MMYLFDTDTLSNLLKRTPAARLLAKLATVPASQRCISAITVGELVYGAARRGEQGIQLRERIERDVIEKLQILSFDEVAAREYGTLRADLERRGQPLADADLRIAAIALVNGSILVTGNERHFRRIAELSVENWL